MLDKGWSAARQSAASTGTQIVWSPQAIEDVEAIRAYLHVTLRGTPTFSLNGWYPRWKVWKPTPCPGASFLRLAKLYRLRGAVETTPS